MMKFFPHISFESLVSGLKQIFIRALRYGICRNPDMGSKHIAYQPVGGRIKINSLHGKGTMFTIPLEKHGHDGF